MKRLLFVLAFLLTCAAQAFAASPVTLGTFIGDPGSGAPAAATFQSMASAMGQNPTAVDTYVEFKDGPAGWGKSADYSAWGIADFNAKHNTNMMPVVGIPMATSKDSASADFKALASGANDAQLNAIFDAYAKKGFKAIDIRPGWEMNGDWYAWSVNPGNAADFKAAFQHIAKVAHAYQNMLVGVTWNPGYVTSSTSYMSIFPGADSVDSIGIDTYGKGSGAPSTAPLDTSTNPNTYTLLDAIALAKASNRPLSLPETGAGPGDTEFPKNLADVLTKSGVAVSYMNIWNDPTGGSGNLQWSYDDASRKAWNEAYARIAKANPQGASSGVFTGSLDAAAASTAPAAQWSYTSPPVNYGSAPQATPAAPADPTYLPIAPSDCPRIPASTVAGTGGVAPQAGGSMEPPATGYVPWYAQGNFVPSSRRKD